jgi:hypothetical protein
MKNPKSLLFIILAFATLSLVVGCSSDKKDDDNPLVPGNNSQISMTFNGAGFSNQTVTLSNGLSSYSASQNYTAIIFSGKAGADSVYFYVVFDGNQTGTKSWDNNNGVIMYRSASGVNYNYLGASNGTLNITSYEAVGGKVGGTLSGQMVDVTDTTVAISITNGNFSSTRVTDVP